MDSIVGVLGFALPVSAGFSRAVLAVGFPKLSGLENRSSYSVHWRN